MKQKYTITIGDVQMNVISEESPESVEKVVGHVDRKIREINLKSSRCSKHEAALLCALDYCTEKLSLQAKLNELEEQNDKLFRALERLQRENEKLGESLDLEQSRNSQLTTDLQAAQAAAAKAHEQAQAAAAAAIAASEGKPATVPATVPQVVTAPTQTSTPAPAKAEPIKHVQTPMVSVTTVPMAVVAPVAPASEEQLAAPSVAAENKPPVVTGIPADAPAPAPTPAPVPAQTPAVTPAVSAPVTPTPAAETPAPAATPATPVAKPTVGTSTPVDHILQKKKTYSYRSSAAARAKNKVGNMFETLTFHDDE